MKALPPPILLRSPPFPGVAAQVAAVSASADTEQTRVFDPDRVTRLVQAMCDARVGGAFWDPANDPWRNDNEEARLIAAMRGDPALAHRRLLEGIAYRDPFTGAPASPEDTIALLGFWRREIERNPAGAVTGAGIARWKRDQVRQLLWAGRGSRMRFAASAAGALRAARRSGGTIVAWPARTAADLPDRAAAQGTPLHRIEDGFIRSVGLGADCHPPFSIVLDRQGAHYDPSRPSDLETILAEGQFSPELLARADALIALIVASRISKYESDGGGGHMLPPRTGRRILVTGQVEDDLSVLSGGGAVRGNLDLLRRARAIAPDAEIWFKPHPDVDAGHRKGHIPDAEALALADRIVRGIPMAALFDAIDEIHVLTSLAGFEALLRGIKVTTHGVPFYAGWGLTDDRGAVPPRRNRSLSLNALVAGVLLLYPRYLDPLTNLPCTPEVLIRRLSDQARPQETWLTRLRHLQGKLRRPFGG